MDKKNAVFTIEAKKTPIQSRKFWAHCSKRHTEILLTKKLSESSYTDTYNGFDKRANKIPFQGRTCFDQCPKMMKK